MPGYLAGTRTILGHHARDAAVAFFPGREIVLLLVGAAICLGFLVMPVVWGSLSSSFSTAAEKAAPATFLTGLGFLLAGLAMRVLILDGIGTCLMVAVMLGWVVTNY
ncbi:MAG: hypothetical protein ACLPUO_02390 [Streptosporangiaceae bacterium]